LKTHTSFLKRFVRILTWLVVGIFVLAVAGAAYQVIATQSDRRNYLAPGQLVDVGGFRLHINCTGLGSGFDFKHGPLDHEIHLLFANNLAIVMDIDPYFTAEV